MARKKTKKNKLPKASDPAPMPSLIFNEGTLENNSPTPKADQIETELREPVKTSTFKHLSSYNPSARRLMWVAVVLLTFVVCGMWSFSIYSQLTSINWSQNPERDLIAATKNNWQNSFRDQNGNRLTTEARVNNIKSNLEKLFAGSAASSSSTSTPEVSTTTP